MKPKSGDFDFKSGLSFLAWLHRLPPHHGEVRGAFAGGGDGHDRGGVRAAASLGWERVAYCEARGTPCCRGGCKVAQNETMLELMKNKHPSFIFI